MSQSPDITAKSWLIVSTLGFVWGGTFMVQALALEHMPPFWVAAARIGFAAVLTVAIWRVRGARMFTTATRDWPLLSVVSLFSAAIPFLFLSWGQQFVTSGFTGVSMAAVALIVLPMAHFMVPGERMTLRRTAGFVIGFAGVVVLIGPGAFDTSGSDMEIRGRMACLAAASCYAVTSILMRRLPPIDAVGLSAATLVFGAVFVIPLAWITHGPPPNPGLWGGFLLAILGLIPTAAANLLRVVLIRSAGPVFMSLTNYMVPLWSVLLGALVLGEALPPSLFAAMALILGGVGLSQYGALKRLFRR